MDLGTPLWGVQLIRALQERMPNALIANQLEGQRSFRLDPRLLNCCMVHIRYHSSLIVCVLTSLLLDVG